MKKHRKTLLIMLLPLVIFLSSCSLAPDQPQREFAASLQPFSDALAFPDLSNMAMTGYIKSWYILDGAVTIEELIGGIKENAEGDEIYIDNATLQQEVALLSRINAENFILVKDSIGAFRADMYFVFESNNHEKLLEIALGGYTKEPMEVCDKEINRTLLVNGYEVYYNEVFYDFFEGLIVPRLQNNDLLVDPAEFPVP